MASNNIDKTSPCIGYGIDHYQQICSCIFLTTWINISDKNKKRTHFLSDTENACHECTLWATSIIHTCKYQYNPPPAPPPSHCGAITYTFIISSNIIQSCYHTKILILQSRLRLLIFLSPNRIKLCHVNRELIAHLIRMIREQLEIQSLRLIFNMMNISLASRVSLQFWQVSIRFNYMLISVHSLTSKCMMCR